MLFENVDISMFLDCKCKKYSDFLYFNFIICNLNGLIIFRGEKREFMIDIDIEKTERDYYIITFENENGKFIIEFCGNLDLYWNYYPKNVKLQDIDEAVFQIPKLEKVLYPIFLKLYRAIKYSRPFSNSIYDFEDNHKKLPSYHCSEKIGLYKDGVVTWVSDDDDLEKGSKIQIEQTKKGILIRFIKGYPEFGRPSFFVRFRNSGSRYHPYNCAFMNQYQEFIKIF